MPITFFMRKIGPVHVVEPGLMAGRWQAGRQVAGRQAGRWQADGRRNTGEFGNF